MQSVKMKDGSEIVSLILDEKKAQTDIVQRFIKKSQMIMPDVLNELSANFPAVPGAIILLRYVNELVDLDGCSEDFKKLVRVQREIVLKCIGDIQPTDDDVKHIL